ncbi:putative surface protein with fasciclin (FAS1) repeats [Kushneria sinocarnis]|uniref:Putative surface protein with fasciclin (FAS1) repeats n=1 Tax=Kushneria sinocarnis TaxID=595502 RepID=A0A420WX57_9GAMM|nr:fasciclin domain-containing protein [Kushneria sinocarnis]RKR04315.1 putative surface protein with fasciclin (FAS1) repeats [Kushneria sinocarnis]
MLIRSGRRLRRRSLRLGGLLLGMLLLLPVQVQAQSLLEAARADGHYHWFLRAVHETRLEQSLAELPAVTLLAPTDAAFEAMDEQERRKLFSLRNRDRLLDVLNLHVIERAVTLDQALEAGMLGSRQGQALHFVRRSGVIGVNGAHITGKVADTPQGRLFGLDRVLLPTL